MIYDHLISPVVVSGHPISLFWLSQGRSIQKTYGDRAFAVAALHGLWNALPNHMRQPGISLATFKKSLKTYLFKKAFFANIL